MPGSWLFQYSLRKAYSVALSCVTWYCSGLSVFLSSSLGGFVQLASFTLVHPFPAPASGAATVFTGTLSQSSFNLLSRPQPAR